MQLSDLRQQVRRHLAELTPDLFPDVLINLKLDRAQIDLAGRYDLIQTTAVLPFSGPFLTMPADFIHPGDDKPKVMGKELVRTDLNDLLVLDQYALASGSQSGTPTRFVYEESLTLNGLPNTFGLWPAGAGSIVLTYTAKPAPLIADNSEPWNGKYQSFHELVAMYVANILQIEQGSSAAGNPIFYSIYQRRLQEMSGYVARSRIGKRIRIRSRLANGGWNT